MSQVASRPFAGASDLPLLIDFARQATRERLPGPTYYHAGDIVWQLYRAGPGGDVRLWLDGAAVVALAIYERPLNFHYEVLRGHELLEPDVIAWAEDLRASTPDAESTPIAYQMLGIRHAVHGRIWPRLTAHHGP